MRGQEGTALQPHAPVSMASAGPQCPASPACPQKGTGNATHHRWYHFVICNALALVYCDVGGREHPRNVTVLGKVSHRPDRRRRGRDAKGRKQHL